MRRATLSLLRCPACAGALTLAGGAAAEEIVDGSLSCAGCGGAWPIERGIARFVPGANYADNFAVQWQQFRQVQLDSHTGRPISRERLLGVTGWAEADFRGALILDAGCGAGRFAEAALALGARVIALDFSGAIDAARENLEGKGDVDFVQADINAMPFAPGAFERVYCLGVLQHTPDPGQSFRSLARIVAPGGRLAFDVYPAGWKNIFFSKYWIRPLTTRISAKRSLGIARRLFPPLYWLSRLVGRIPLAGHYLRYVIPVANYTNVYPLDRKQLREWALLDTFDMWAPAYDNPQSEATVRGWFAGAGFAEVEISRPGHLVGRGMKPVS